MKSNSYRTDSFSPPPFLRNNQIGAGVYHCRLPLCKIGLNLNLMINKCKITSYR